VHWRHPNRLSSPNPPIFTLSPSSSTPSAQSPSAFCFPRSVNLFLGVVCIAKTISVVPAWNLAHEFAQVLLFQELALQVLQNNVLYGRTLPPTHSKEAIYPKHAGGDGEGVPAKREHMVNEGGPIIPRGPLPATPRAIDRAYLIPIPYSLPLGFTHRFTTSVSRFTSTYVNPIDSKQPCTSA